MTKLNLISLSAAAAAALLATAAGAAPIPSGLDHGGITLAARQANEAPRGEGKGHRLSDDASTTTAAREAEKGDDRGHHGKGHRLSDDSATNVARQTNEGPRGEGKGHRATEERTNDIA
jgi:hypothetical protein